MTSFAESIKASLDAIRGIPSEIGVRPYSVTVRVVTWSGARVGLGTPTTTDTRVRCGTGDPAVRLVSARDVVASGGALQATDLRIGPLTPGEVPLSALDPATSASPTEVLWVLTGPGLPAGGALYQAVERDVSRALSVSVVVRKIGA